MGGTSDEKKLPDGFDAVRTESELHPDLTHADT